MGILKVTMTPLPTWVVIHWWECFTLNQRFWVRALGMEKVLLGAPLPNRPCIARFEFSQSSNVDSGHRMGNQKDNVPIETSSTKQHDKKRKYKIVDSPWLEDSDSDSDFVNETNYKRNKHFMKVKVV
ncbi:hypothetical protein H5410_047536 [Solanum commersonii]|uniref:Uncharacterized protein n=1 Tax=Solanum commersonii TaxID=4109 RepID=A0A9J5XIY8_SOLCO|nr:hypothetical protein H5410_047536 [Solanum commersonii]